MQCGDMLNSRQNILQCIAEELDKECSRLCSIKQPSCLHETSKQQMLNFSFEEMDRELQVEPHSSKWF